MITILAGGRGAIVAEHAQLQSAHDALTKRVERLKHLLRKLRRLHYGSKSKRLP